MSQKQATQSKTASTLTVRSLIKDQVTQMLHVQWVYVSPMQAPCKADIF